MATGDPCSPHFSNVRNHGLKLLTQPLATDTHGVTRLEKYRWFLPEPYTWWRTGNDDVTRH
ncbi:hypothetical protein D9M71_771680 [compost metagenome]